MHIAALFINTSILPNLLGHDSEYDVKVEDNSSIDKDFSSKESRSS
jgi:hypothetical protein